MPGVQEVKRLEAELAGAREETHNNLLSEIARAIDALTEIGYDYQLVEKAGAAKEKGASRSCSLCQRQGHTKTTCPSLERNREAQSGTAGAELRAGE